MLDEKLSDEENCELWAIGKGRHENDRKESRVVMVDSENCLLPDSRGCRCPSQR
jgi:hypothetical protein